MPNFNITIDDASPIISYRGTWSDTNKGDAAYSRYANSTFHATSSSSTASFSFNGTGVYLYGAKRENHGTFFVSVDGQVTTQNGQSNSATFQSLLYARSDLPYGEHQVVLSNTGAPAYVDLDYVVITTGDGKADTPEEHFGLDDGAFTYSEGWQTPTTSLNSRYFNSTFHSTNVPNASATLKFKGNAMSLFGATSNNHGMFSVAMDGGADVVLNGTSPEFRPDTVLYRWDGLPDGDHVLTVKNLDTNYVDIDRVVVKRYSSSSSSGNGTASTDIDDQSSNQKSNSSPSHIGMIVGAIVATLVFLGLVGICIWLLRKQRDAKRRHGPAKEIKRDGLHGDRNSNVREQGDLSGIPVQQLVVNPFQDPVAVVSYSNGTHAREFDAPPPAYDARTPPVPGVGPSFPPSAHHYDAVHDRIVAPVIPSEKSIRFRAERSNSSSAASHLALSRAPSSATSLYTLGTSQESHAHASPSASAAARALPPMPPSPSSSASDGTSDLPYRAAAVIADFSSGNFGLEYPPEKSAAHQPHQSDRQFAVENISESPFSSPSTSSPSDGRFPPPPPPRQTGSSQ